MAKIGLKAENVQLRLTTRDKARLRKLADKLGITVTGVILLSVNACERRGWLR